MSFTYETDPLDVRLEPADIVDKLVAAADKELNVLEAHGALVLEFNRLEPTRLHIPVNGTVVNDSLCDSCSLQANCLEERLGEGGCPAFPLHKRYMDATHLISDLRRILT